MRKELILASILGLSAGLAPARPFFGEGQDPRPVGMAWDKVEAMSDDFDGPALDRTKWQDQPAGNGWVWIGRPPALFKASNVTIRDGKMAVTVGKLDAPVVLGQRVFTHQGAIVRSLNAGQVGWYFECRMKANQTVMSSTFWLMTKGHTRKKLELDIQECVGRTTDLTEDWGKHWDRIFHSNAIHRKNQYNPESRRVQACVKTETRNWERYYVYGAWWKSPEEIQCFLDGEYVYSLRPTIEWTVPAYIQMAIETYDWNPIPRDGCLVETGTWEQRTTLYDWVRAWELVPEAPPPRQTPGH